MLKHMPGLALTWVGIVGAAITLFTGLLAPLDMADWAWWLAENWQDASPLVWDRVGSVLGAEMPAILVPALTMSVFLIMTGLGVGLRERQHRAPAIIGHPALQFGATMTALLVMGYALLSNSPQASSDASVPSDAPLAIFLAGTTVSFSRPVAGGGNLATRLWFVLLGTGGLLALNEVTKLMTQLLFS